MGDTKWSKAEKKAARKSFDIAYNRECTDFIKRIKLKAENLAKPKDIWELHDFMTKELKISRNHMTTDILSFF